MAQIVPVWKEIPEFCSMASKLIARYPEKFAKIESDWFVAYGCVNKTRPEKKAKVYDMSGECEPESFTNSKKYFIKFFMADWEGRSDEAKLALVFSALLRVDRDNPESGKVIAMDYQDQSLMVRTFGPDWQMNGEIPNLLESDIRFVEDANKEEAILD